MSLDIVLPPCKVPHKIAQIQMADLVAEQELQVVHERGVCRVVYGPKLLVSLPVCAITAIHTRKQYLAAAHHHLRLSVGNFIFILFLVQDVDGFFIDQVLNFCIVQVTQNKRTVPVLFPVQIGKKGKDIFRTVFIHWRTCQGADDDQGIG